MSDYSNRNVGKYYNATGEELQPMSQIKRSLWMRFVTIAQPYFFPNIRGGTWMILLLMIMLLVFLFGILFLVVAGITLLGHQFAPVLTGKIAAGCWLWLWRSSIPRSR